MRKIILSHPLLDLLNASLSFRGARHVKTLFFHLVLDQVAKLTIESDGEVLLIAQGFTALFYARVQLIVIIPLPTAIDSDDQYDS